jgi:hypothetical protein
MRPLPRFAAAALAALALALVTPPADAAAPAFTKRPTLAPNTNLRAPMVGILRFTADQPVTTIVSIDDRSRRWEMEFDPSWDPSKGIPLIGLEADVRHEVFVSVRNAAGETTRFPNKLVFVPQPMSRASASRGPRRSAPSPATRCSCCAAPCRSVRRTAAWAR